MNPPMDGRRCLGGNMTDSVAPGVELGSQMSLQPARDQLQCEIENLAGAQHWKKLDCCLGLKC